MSGDAFFLDSFGAPSVPAGTITVQETKAPLGYVINNEVHTVHFTLREDGTVRSDSGTWNTANGLEDLSLVSEETAVCGGVRICKTDSVTGSSQSSIGTSLAGAEITVYNNCGKTITLKDGTRESLIKPMLSEGSIVTTPRTATNFVVTEYGIANLKGKNTWQRAELLINIAHPDFRDDLIKQAEKMGIWKNTSKVSF